MFRKITVRFLLPFLCVAIIANVASLYIQIKDFTTPKVVLKPHIEKNVYPVELQIPSIGVVAHIEAMGVGTDGKMQVPERSGSVSWYKPGTRPGLKGNAVIAGHYDNMFGLPAVFYRLDRLKNGDEIIVKNNDKSLVHFKVAKSFSYNSKANDKDVFGPTIASRLNLITCDGSWNPTIGGYPKRLVVFADKF